MVKNGFWVLICAMALLAAPPLMAEEAPIMLKDLSQLNLKVKNTEEVEGIEVPSLNMGVRTLAPEGGQKLVVVTLEGNAEKPCAISIEGADFDAIFEAAMPGGAVEILKPTAISLKPDYWIFSGTGHGESRSQTHLQAGPVTVKLAWMLPRSVETFSVRYPTLVEGEARIAKAGEATSGKETKAKEE